ncbi:predicted protein [Naegleria gruberi]|uniref:Rab GDP dissociation inhibitor n=1 Tax=Naegleria gruberi TaxID=5762 RepID=D2VFY3_NAEGR|nr:uncharacterized protein NAEGRDRAFT_60634 [Naegleria gruberi]EFC44161.1 predicted protein [Naegleria gruberi]|eukprot:XP_002676905.1 predicted protein [Naegleria gruberi strain NEG-M]
MESEYDIVVLGTGLTESILAALMTLKGYKVLIRDRNKYYGGEIASLNLNQMFEMLKGDSSVPPIELGSSKDYNIDLIPKLALSSGKLVKILRSLGVIRMGIELSPIDSAFVYHENSFVKIPIQHYEIIHSPLVTGSNPIQAKNLLNFLSNYNQNDPTTHQGLDCSKLCIGNVFEHFNVDEETINYLGHVVGMYSDDSFVNETACEFIEKVSLYEESLNENGKSPFLYPKYGLGELTQVLNRFSVLNEATCMLDAPVEKIHYDENGHVCGVESDGIIARCQMIIGDSSYFTERVQCVGKVIHAVCILSHHPIPQVSNSCQIIFPKPQNHKHDIYCRVLKHNQEIAPNGKFLVSISTIAETQDPESEIKDVLALLEPIEEKFISIRMVNEPTENLNDGVFITKSYDASMHLESCVEDVEDLYEKICGEKLDFTKFQSSFLL